MNQLKNTRAQQQGAALIIVLFIVALAAVIAAEMATNLMIQVQRAQNIQTHQQAKWYSYGAEELVKKVLIESKKKDPDKVHLGQPWALEETPFPVDHGTLSGKVTDLQACLNLNALRKPKAQNASTNDTNPAHKAFLELLKNIEDLPAEESEEALADGVYDWLDSDSITFRSGAEEDEYMSQRTPYLTANNYFASVSELRVIRGFNPLVMEKLLPYVCVIPGSEELKINVNTIQPEQALLISALIEGLSESDAQSIISSRPEQGYDKVEDFLSEATAQGAQNINQVTDLFTVNSDYFKLRAKAMFDERLFTMTSIIQIKQGQASILARKFGGVQ
ncbi:MAG: type II secretion system minor pseudopilin GspK [Pseudomonadota bacterium]|uniref:type II secretion system minor pseudopilin GspK n=1 Tax=Pseudoalteromonas phenolica TaxID=161398 RepID=UPI000C09A5FF|nr:general secretion pathway protein GspK [Pseudoalteromonas sp.]|tara:strand:- start:1737 stop:2738 length:1002 start_codon:yes stop_codon:yes gene_type:complete